MAQKINWTQIDTSNIPKNKDGIPYNISLGDVEYENYLKSIYSSLVKTKKLDAETYEIPQKDGVDFNKVILWNPLTKEVTYGEKGDGHSHPNIETLDKLSEIGDDLTYNGDVVLTEKNHNNYFDGDKNYIHDQGVPLSVWTIYHDLRKECSVTVKDSAQTEVEGTVKVNNGTVVIIEFNSPFSGKAILN